MYCFPPTAYEIGNPLTGDPRFVSHNTFPVLSSKLETVRSVAAEYQSAAGRDQR